MELDYVSAVTVGKPPVQMISTLGCTGERTPESEECGKASPKIFINTTREFILKSSVDGGRWGEV